MNRAGPRLLAGLVAVSGLAACFPNLDVPEGARVSCATADDCPSGLVCSGSGRCLPPGSIDSTLPDLARPPLVSPKPARAGQIVTIALEVTEPLGEPPEVTLLLGPPVHPPCAASGELAWTCTYTVTGEEQDRLGGEVPFGVRLVDRASNVTVRRDVQLVELDLLPPTIVRQDLAPEVARPGAVLELTLAVSEPLAAVVALDVSPELTGERRRLPLTRVPGTLLYRVRHEIGPADPAGLTHLSIVLEDEVGNRSGTLGIGAFRVDPTPLRLAGSSVNRAFAKQGATLEATFTLSKVLPPALQPKVLLGELALEPDPSVAQPAWRFTRTIAESDAEGPRTLLVEARDEAGNVLVESLGTVTIDRQAPAIRAVRASPAAVRPGGTVVLVVQADEPLAEAPAVFGVGPATLAFTRQPQSESGFEHVVANDAAEGAYGLRVSMRDRAGNEATEELGPQFEIDATAPRITGLEAGPARIDEDGTVTVTFTLDALVPLESVEARLGGRTMDCLVEEAAAARYGCTRSQRGDELAPGEEASQVVLVQARDPAGNTGTSSTAVVFDFRDPDLVPGSATLALEAARDSLVRDVGALAPGARARLGFTVDEPLAASPVVVTSPVALAFSAASATLTSFSFVYEHAAGVPDGPLATAVRLRDEAGNEVVRPLVTAPGLALDSAAPAAPDVLSATRLVHLRAPWGTAAGGPAPRFALGGEAGSVAGNATVVAFDRSSAEGRVELGRTTARADGSFAAMPVGLADRRDLYVCSVDGAGNASAVVRVRNVVWTATLAGKVPGSAFENPHSVVLAGRASPTLAAGRGRVAEPDGTGLAAVATVDGDAARTSVEAVWRARQPGFPDVRRHHAMAFDPVRGRAVMFGGVAAGRRVDETWEWDGEQWDIVGDTGVQPSARMGASLVFDSERARIVMFGGFGGTGVGSYLDDLWEFDGRLWTERRPSSELPAGRRQAVLVYDPLRERLVLFGGAQLSGAPLRDTWEFDGTRWSRRATAGPPGRFSSAGAFDPVRGRVVLFGGSGDTTVLGDTWEWDGTSWTERHPAGPRPSPRTSHTLVWDPARARTVLFGGGDAVTSSSEVWEWDGTAWTPRLPAGGQPASFFEHAATWDTHRGEMLVFGGGGEDDQCWIWSDRVWQDRSAGVFTPGARVDAASAYDDARGRTLVFGGLSGSAYRSDPREFDGTRWFGLGTGGPGARYAATMTYDASRLQTLLFGGVAVGGLMTADLWSWDGAAWARTLPSGARPAARAGAMLAFDRARGRTVLFGGLDDDLNLFRDTWEWDGASWSLVATTGPGPRAFGGMAYDEARGVTVLHSGLFDTSSVSDLWEWDGATWTQRTAAGRGPVARTSHTLVYDPARRRIVLFGGENDGGGARLSDVWEWDGGAWTEVTPSLAGPLGRSGHTAAFDRRRGRLVVTGGQNALQLGDVWELENTRSMRPAALVSFDWRAAGAPLSAVKAVEVAAWAGGSGESALGNAVAGVELAWWSKREGGWTTAAASSSPEHAPGPIGFGLADAAARSSLLRGESLHLRLQPAAGQGQSGRSDLALDALELRVRYRRDEP